MSITIPSVSLSRVLTSEPTSSVLWTTDPGTAEPRIASPVEVMNELSTRFPYDLQTGQYFTMVYGVIDVRARQLTYTAAGHPGPILIPAKGEVKMQNSTGLPVGMLPGVNFREQTVNLVPGDRLFLYTDGVTEALDDNDEEFGKQRLLEALEDGRKSSLRKTARDIVRRVHEWQGGGVGFDDLSLLGAEIS